MSHTVTKIDHFLSCEQFGPLDLLEKPGEQGYLAMLAEVLARGLPAALCTIYYPRFPDRAFQRMAVAGLTVFNDRIIQAAFAHGLPLLDLRLICTEEGDYANPIEPSARGGEKIARAVAGSVGQGFAGGRIEVFT